MFVSELEFPLLGFQFHVGQIATQWKSSTMYYFFRWCLRVGSKDNRVSANTGGIRAGWWSSDAAVLSLENVGHTWHHFCSNPKRSSLHVIRLMPHSGLVSHTSGKVSIREWNVFFSIHSCEPKQSMCLYLYTYIHAYTHIKFTHGAH